MAPIFVYFDFFDNNFCFPIFTFLFGYKYFKGYVQGFSGYGQSLVDYNTHHNSIGVGIALSDWL